MFYTQTRTGPGEWDANIFWDFEIQINYLIPAGKQDLGIIKKKRTCWIADFVLLADDWVKIKENETRDKYLDRARELINQQNMKVMVIPVVISTDRTIPKGFVRGLEELKIGLLAVIITTKALCRLTRILRRVPETWGELLSLQWKNINKFWCEKLAWNNIMTDFSIKKLEDHVRTSI